MSPRKLTDSDKKEILELYRNSLETTSTLAIRYGVSSSTVSRFLKTHLSESEYDELIQQKRLARTAKGMETLSSQPLFPLEEAENELEVPENEPESLETAQDEPLFSEDTEVRVENVIFSENTEVREENVIRRRRRSSVITQSISKPSQPVVAEIQEEIPSNLDFSSLGEEVFYEEEQEEMAVTLLEMLGEDVDTEENEDDLDDLDDLDEDLDEEDDLDSQPLSWTPTTTLKIQVLPLSEANFPNPCYLVIDRAAELITRPLKDFGDLGKIPEQEVFQKTLPIFDNHRVARRFSNRSQRVIKIPNGQMLEKTSSHLQAKGITRMFIDGRIYALTNEQ